MKTNGRILPAVERLCRNGTSIPHHKAALPWMDEEYRKNTYAGKSFVHEHRAGILREEIGLTPELFYENRLYETVVGALLRSFLKRNNPDALFYYSSRYDDYRSACDYIVSPSGSIDDLVRVDLTVGDGKIRSFEQNHAQLTINKKIARFHKISWIPEEFFRSVVPQIAPLPLPLIILRIDRPTLFEFIRNFFRIIDQTGTKPDILKYFSHWMHHDKNITQDRISYILGMTKSSDGTSARYDQVAGLAMQIGVLFAGVTNVSTSFPE